MNTPWPTARLINIKKGSECGTPIENMLAVRDPEYKCYYGTAFTLSPLCEDDIVDEWENMVAVPAVQLEQLEEAFRDKDLPSLQVMTLNAVLEHLREEKPSYIAQAVKTAHNIGWRGDIRDYTPVERLSLLLENVPQALPSATRKTALYTIAHICDAWARTIAPGTEILHNIGDKHSKTLAPAASTSEHYRTLVSRIGIVADRVHASKTHLVDALTATAEGAIVWIANDLEADDQ